MPESGFPSPKYPKFEPISRAELKKHLKEWIFRTTLPMKQERPQSNFFPTYTLGKGDKILLVSATEYDSEVMSGYAEAFREKGAQVDIFTMELGSLNPRECAAEEARNLVVGVDNPCYTSFCNVIPSETANSLLNLQKYNLFVAGTAGPVPPNVPTKWMRTPYISAEEVSSPMLTFPVELQIAIDNKVYAQIMSLEKSRLTDPEGTDISWTNYDDGRTMTLSHELGKPCNIGRGAVPDCTGVVAGTLNHMGAFPHIKAHVKNDLAWKIEGGGLYGDIWREKMEELNKLQIPPLPPVFTKKFLRREAEEKFKLPGPGFFWFWEMGIGSTLGMFRLKREMEMRNYANFLHDRSRAGYVHNGFGAPASAIIDCSKANMPWTHVHIHCQFATLEGKTKDGFQVKVIDKGHLTALDDPEIRKLASSYGNPEALLSESWVPAVPGINTKGEYFKDYADDPIKWMLTDASNYNEVKIT
ncbi:MAG: hypothetical protein ACYC7D_03625 [Nitrososphaerales archaeon]